MWKHKTELLVCSTQWYCWHSIAYFYLLPITVPAFFTEHFLKTCALSQHHLIAASFCWSKWSPFPLFVIKILLTQTNSESGAVKDTKKVIYAPPFVLFRQGSMQFSQTKAHYISRRRQPWTSDLPFNLWVANSRHVTILPNLIQSSAISASLNIKVVLIAISSS